MTSVEFQKRMMLALPHGWGGNQMKAEHPNATYEAFLKSQINETARPKSIPYNLAACDSSSYNYASGRLDHQTYFIALDVEREDANDLVLDPLFELWWQEAVLTFGWNADPRRPPPHLWDWPKHPVADIVADVRAMGIRCACRGSAAGSLVCYLTGISDVDAVRHDLAFERFLNPMREELPYIDVDVESARREDV